MTSETSSVVILVEDDPAVLNALNVCFSAHGFETRTYGDAESLLGLSDYPTRGCLVLDIGLPGRDGVELLAELRERGVQLPAVFISTPTREVLAQVYGASVPLVEKPLVNGALLDAVRSSIGAQP